MQNQTIRWLSMIALVCVLLIDCAVPMLAQQPAAVANSSSTVGVPPMVSFSGTLMDLNVKPLTNVTGVTFLLYKEEQGGAPLWMETQNVQPDKTGHYSIMLGSTTSTGLPASLFVAGEARWLGVQPQGQAEQPRIMLLSVPYALKAVDAQTIGGLPASAFVLAAPMTTASTAPSSAAAQPLATGTTAVTTAGGTVNTVAKFDAAADITNSIIFDNGTSVGIGTTTPKTKLDVKGGGTIRGLLSLPATGTATATAGKNSQPIGWTASAFNSGTSKAVNQVFRFQAEPVGNNTISPSGTLNLLFAQGSGAPAETGLNIASTGLITFAPGQTFPGTGSGTVTGVTAGTDLTGGGTSGNVMLNLNTNLVPQLATANTFTNTQTVNSPYTGIYVNPANGYWGVDTQGGGAGVGIGSTYFEFPIYGYTTTGLEAVYAVNGGTAGGVMGVYGVVNGSTTNQLFGVFGNNWGSYHGAGVYGQNTTSGNRSKTGSSWTGAGTGVWGDGGSNNYGVIATTDNYGAAFAANNSAGYVTLNVVNSNASGYPFWASNSANGKGCSINNVGDINCSGSKNAVVPIDGGQRKVALSAIESPKNWFEDFGSEQLSSGSAVVAIDPEFAQTVNTTMDYMVIPVPNGDCKGLYVTNKTPTTFEVRELGGGTSSIRFDYRIVALRKNFENIRMADHTNDPDPLKMVAKGGTPLALDTSKMKPPERPARMLRPAAQTGKPTQTHK